MRREEGAMGSSEDQISWVLQCDVKEGQLDAFNELMEEMVADTSEEPGALNYEWYIADDAGAVHLYERYVDSDAAIAHLDGFKEKWAGRFMGCVNVTRFTVYGNTSDAAREVMAPLGAKQLGRWGGFSR
jgi:quinol monooxygenase YgiN